MVRQSDMTALLGEIVLLMPGYERNSPEAPSGFDRRIPVSGYRLIGLLLLLCLNAVQTRVG